MTERLELELLNSKRTVACARITAFRAECWRLAGLVSSGLFSVSDTADGLLEIADSNGLTLAHGDDRIQAIMAEAFAGANFNPMNAELVV